MFEAIRKEIALTVRDNGSEIEIAGLLQCKFLDAAFQETLRLTSGASSARTVIAPTQLTNSILQKDAKLLMPYRQLHFDEEAFGPQVKDFRPERFLDEKGVGRSPYFKPFGGGITYCSGRFIAKREVYAFVALALHRYDIDLEDPHRGIPRLDEEKPTLGVLGPRKGDATKVLVKPKAKILP